MFLADLDFDPADLLDVLGLFGIVLFVLEIGPLHYRNYLGVLLSVLGAANRIVNPNTACDEIAFLFFSWIGVDDGLAVAVSFDKLLIEPGVIRFSLSYFLTEI